MLNKVVQDIQEGCLASLMRHMSNTAHHKHYSVVVLYVESAHGLVNIRQLHRIE